MKEDDMLADALASVLHKVVVDGVYLDRALHEFFRIGKISDDKFRYSTKEYANFILRHWFEFGGSASRLHGTVYDALNVPLRDIANYEALEPDFPEWFIDLVKSELPECWQNELLSLSDEPYRYIRANKLKCSAPQLKQLLQQQGVKTVLVDGFEDSLKVVGGRELHGTQAFRDGMFEVQDLSSQRVAPFLLKDYSGHGLVVDACAGNGSKTLHLASEMHSKGRILAMDIYSHKLEELKRRAAKSGASNIEVRTIDSTKSTKRLNGKVVYLLLDVPCTGTGVFRRNPESKLRLTMESVEKVRALQADLLTRYSSMVKPGGTLVYSTCSILPSENRQQIDKFLSHDSRFEFVEECSVLPSSGADGFYMARLIRKAC